MSRLHLSLLTVLFLLLALGLLTLGCGNRSGTLNLDDDDSAGADDDDAADDDDNADDDDAVDDDDDDDDDDSPWEGDYEGEVVLTTDEWGDEYDLCWGWLELEIDALGEISGGGYCEMSWDGGWGGWEQGIELWFSGFVHDSGAASGDIEHILPWGDQEYVYPYEGEFEDDDEWLLEWEGVYDSGWGEPTPFDGKAWPGEGW